MHLTKWGYFCPQYLISLFLVKAKQWKLINMLLYPCFTCSFFFFTIQVDQKNGKFVSKSKVQPSEIDAALPKAHITISLYENTLHWCLRKKIFYQNFYSFMQICPVDWSEIDFQSLRTISLALCKLKNNVLIKNKSMCRITVFIVVPTCAAFQLQRSVGMVDCKFSGSICKTSCRLLYLST